MNTLSEELRKLLLGAIGDPASTNELINVLQDDTLPPQDGQAGKFLTTDGSNASWATTGGGGGADTALDNLTTTSINQSLLFDTDMTYDIGSDTIRPTNVFAGNLRKGTADGSSFLIRTDTTTAPGTPSDSITILTGTVTGANSNSGNITALTGTVVVGDGNSGNQSLGTGNIANGNGSSGNVTSFTGAILSTGGGGSSGNQSIVTGGITDNTSSGITGMVSLSSGNNAGTGNSGEFILESGSTTTGTTGSVNIQSGSSTAGSSGDVKITAGSTGPTSFAGEVGIGTSPQTNTGSTSDTGVVQIESGPVLDGTSSGATGSITIKSGDNSGTGNTGPIVIQIGTITSGTRGQIRLVDGTEGTAGYVWTSTDTSGNGAWMPGGGGGGAATDLSNLTPTAINEDLVLAKATPKVKSADSASSAVADLTVSAGDYTGGGLHAGGSVNIASGVSATSSSGLITITSGATNLTNRLSGAVSVFTGDQNAAGASAPSGDLTVSTGQVNDPTATAATGNLILGSGNNAGTTTSGNIQLLIGSGTLRGSIQFVDGSEVTSANSVWASKDTAGSGTWVQQLSDTGGTPSFDYINRVAFDASGNPALRYQSRNLVDTANHVSIDWRNRYLTDNTGTPQVQWNNSGAIISTSLAIQAVATTVLTGTAGTATCSLPFDGNGSGTGAYQKAMIYLSGYTDTGTQTYTFPHAFTNVPLVYGLSAAVAGATITTNDITFTVTTLTGFVFVEGY